MSDPGGPARVDLDDRRRDALPVNEPYTGFVAEWYDMLFPPDAEYGDAAYFQRAIEHGGGRALELGCGTGRLLLRYLAAGLDVEGVDGARDMLAICRAHAEARGLAVVLHEGSFTPLDLGRRYQTVYCPAGTFQLVEDDAAARGALASFLAHLGAGGKVYVDLSVPHLHFGDDYEWRVRRSATRESDGVTVVVHEALRCDTARQERDALLRWEWFDPTGRLVDTRLRRQRLHWWRRDEFEGLLRDVGFVDVHSQGGHEEWVSIGTAPG